MSRGSLAIFLLLVEPVTARAGRSGAQAGIARDLPAPGRAGDGTRRKIKRPDTQLSCSNRGTSGCVTRQPTPERRGHTDRVSKARSLVVLALLVAALLIAAGLDGQLGAV